MTQGHSCTDLISLKTLRYKLSSVRREYYDVRTTWDAITSVVQMHMNHDTSKQICVLLPLLANADPASFGHFALQDVVAVLTSDQARENGEHIISLINRKSRLTGPDT